MAGCSPSACLPLGRAVDPLAATAKNATRILHAIPFGAWTGAARRPETTTSPGFNDLKRRLLALVRKESPAR
jgi:hypothetical protein